MTYKDLRQYGFAPNECDYIIDLIQKEKSYAIEECIYIVNHYIGTEHIVAKLEMLKEQLKEKLKE